MARHDEVAGQSLLPGLAKVRLGEVHHQDRAHARLVVGPQYVDAAARVAAHGDCHPTGEAVGGAEAHLRQRGRRVLLGEFLEGGHHVGHGAAVLRVVEGGQLLEDEAARDDVAGDVDVQEAQLEELGGLDDAVVVPGVAVQLHLLLAPLDGGLGAGDGDAALHHLVDLVAHHPPAGQGGLPLGVMGQDGITLEIARQEQVPHVAVDRRQDLLDVVAAHVNPGVARNFGELRQV